MVYSADAERAETTLRQALDTVLASPDDPRVSLGAREKVIAEILRLRRVMHGE